MATADISTTQAEDKERLRDDWLENLSHLVETVRGWARELDWSTRQIEKKMEESQFGTYKAPALILQKETVRVTLEPIARFATGVEGIIDLYLMPAYDDVARLCFYDDRWHLHSMFDGMQAVTGDPKAEDLPLTKEVFQGALEAMTSDAA